MDSGAYGSYPRFRFRKRIGYGKGKRFFRSRGKTSNAFVSRFNPYTFKKTQVGRLTKTNMQSVKCTYTPSNIQLASGATVYTFDTSGDSFLNLTTIIQQSPEFLSRQTQYSYYMVRGIQVVLTRQWIDPIAFGVAGVSDGFDATTFSFGLQSISMNFYPNLVNTAVGVSTQQADSSWECSPFIQGKQSHYQPFPKNFTTGSNSNGLGTWNACSAINSLQGELAIYNNPNIATYIGVHTGAIFVWDVEINVYLSFCNNTGS